MTRILVVDDEPGIREVIRLGLRRAGFEYDEAGDAEQARERIAAHPPDLILLDWMLPGISGIELARSLRRAPATRDIPIILLTARDQEADKVRGLEGGADDYVTKPFSSVELVARIKAVLRRSDQAGSQEVLDIEGLRVDIVSHRVSAGGTELNFTPIEFQLLCQFMRNPDRVFSRAQLIDKAWGSNVYVEERTVDVHIRRLRKLLEPSGHDRIIQTVRGAGYRLSIRAPAGS